MKFIPSVLIMFFSVTFAGIWLLEKQRRHMLIYSLSFFCFACGLVVQVVPIPADKASSVILSSILYLSGALLLSEGVLLRSNQKYNRVTGGIFFISAMTLVVYLISLDSNFFYLAAVVNFSIGVIILCGCWQARFLWRGNKIERMFFAVLLVLGLHFFVRTFLTVDALADVDEPSILTGTLFWEIMTIVITILSVCVGLTLLVVVTADIIIELQKERDSDPLTSLLNRRGLDRKMHGLKTKSDKQAINIIVADLDNFKRINDEFGHAIGDQVLVEIAGLLQRLDKEIILSRIGGEEFVIVLKGSMKETLIFAEGVRQTVADYSFSCLPEGYKMSCSLGIAAMRAGEAVWDTFGRADNALINAKRSGRNRVISEPLFKII